MSIMNRFVPLMLAGALVLTGCTSDNEQPPVNGTSAPSTSNGSAPAPTNVPEQTPEPQVTVNWADTFKPQGDYSAEQVKQAATTVEEFSKAAYVNPYFLSGDWADDPTGNNVDSIIGAYFTPERRTEIVALNLNNTDPDSVSTINSLLFLLRDVNTPVQLATDNPVTSSFNNLQISVESSTGLLKASYVVDTQIPLVLQDGKSTSTQAKYTINLWLAPSEDGQNMLIDGYANSWQIAPYTTA